jgi:hypothetical protein
MSEIPAKSSKKLSEALNREFPASTVIVHMRAPKKAKEWIVSTEAGMQTVARDQQSANAHDAM